MVVVVEDEEVAAPRVSTSLRLYGAIGFIVTISGVDNHMSTSRVAQALPTGRAGVNHILACVILALYVK